MKEDKKHFGTGIVTGVISLLLIMLITVLTVAYTGSYNIAASEDHSPFVRWMFTTTMHNSISSRASDITPPESFTDEMVRAGAREYKAMCQHCHGGAGVRPDKWSRGMLPQPPHLPEAVREWEANEVFWIAKHGIKMTGMPSFGQTHSDESIWNITAFAMRLPGMTREEYDSYGTGQSGGHRHGNGTGSSQSNGHGHSH